MNLELPPDVIAAVQANRKVEAIKLLRQHASEKNGGMGLKEAKVLIDIYIAENPQLISAQSNMQHSGFGRILLTGIIFALLYGLYELFVGAK